MIDHGRLPVLRGNAAGNGAGRLDCAPANELTCFGWARLVRALSVDSQTERGKAMDAMDLAVLADSLRQFRDALVSTDTWCQVTDVLELVEERERWAK